MSHADYVKAMLSHKYLVDMGGAGPWSRRAFDAVAAGGIILQHVRAYVHFQRIDYPIKHLIVPWRTPQELVDAVRASRVAVSFCAPHTRSVLTRGLTAGARALRVCVLRACAA